MVMLLQPRSLQVLNLRPRDLLKKETTPLWDGKNSQFANLHY
jgi:hypothetical protein